MGNQCSIIVTSIHNVLMQSFVNGKFDLETYKLRLIELKNSIVKNGFGESDFLDAYKQYIALRKFRLQVFAASFGLTNRETIINLDNILAWIKGIPTINETIADIERQGTTKSILSPLPNGKKLREVWYYNNQVLDAFMILTLGEFAKIRVTEGLDNLGALNEAIARFYTDKLSSLIGYLIETELLSQDDIKTLQEVPVGIAMFLNGTPQAVWNKIEPIFTKYFSGGVESYIKYYTGVWSSPRAKRLQKKARAYGDFLVLLPNMFDYLIKTHLSGISINNSIGKLTLLGNKKYSYKLDKGVTTWQEEDSYNLARFLPGVLLTEIMSWNMWHLIINEGLNKTWVESEYVHPTNAALVFAVFSKIMKLGTSPIAKNTIIKLDFIKYLKDCGFTMDASIKEIGKVPEAVGFGKVFNKYFLGKNLADIISSVPQNPLYILPMLMAILISPSIAFESKFARDTKHVSEYSFNPNDVGIIYTIWKNMFDPKSSKLMWKNDRLMYVFLTLAFLTHDLKSMYGILCKEGNMEKSFYSLGKANKRLNNLQLRILGLYPPTVEKKFLSAKVETDLANKLVTITCGEYAIQVKAGKVSVFHDKLAVTMKESKEALEAFTPLFQEALALDFSQNSELPLLNALINILGGPKNVLNNLTTIVGNLIYAYEISKLFKDLLDSSDFLRLVKEYYKGSNNDSSILLVTGITDFLINVFKLVFPLVTKLSIANDLHEKVASDNTVKGGSGELLNLETLTSLTTKYPQFVGEKITGQSIIKDFSLHDIIKEISFYRDHVDAAGNVKTATSMSVEELFLSTFFYDFYAPGDTFSTVLGVFSDKPNLGRIEMYNKEILVDGKLKRVSLLTAKEVLDLASKELGNYYISMATEMLRQLDTLSKYSGLKFNLLNDYTEINALGYSKEKLLELIHNAIVKAQAAGEEIEINDLLFFSWDGNTLHAKPTLIYELHKVGYIDGSTINPLLVGLETNLEFFKRKEIEFVTNLLLDLKNGVCLVDDSGESLSSPAILNLKKRNPYEAKDINKGWRTNKALILAKLINGEDIHRLVTKKDLKNWSVYKLMLEYAKAINLNTTQFDIDGEFNMLRFIEFVNNNYVDAYNLHRINRLKKLSVRFLVEHYKNTTKELTAKLKKLVLDLYRNFITLYVLEGRFDKQIAEKVDPNLDEVAYATAFEKARKEFIEIKVLNLEYAYNQDPLKWINAYAHTVAENTKIESIKDVKKILSKATKDSNSVEASIKADIKEELNKEEVTTNPNYRIEVNPELTRYNALGYWSSEEALNSLVGSHINQEVRYDPNVQTMNSAEVSALSKRNVSLSSAKNLYVRKDPRGMGSHMTIAVVQDTYGNISTINGIEDPKGSKPLDGATYGNYVSTRQAQYSLGALESCLENSKPICNDLNPKTGTGAIIKTCVFTLDNQRIRTSQRNINLHRKMNDIPWKLEYGFNGDFLTDYNGQKINYKPVFLYKPSTEKFYYRTNFTILNDGKTLFDEYELPEDFSELVRQLADLNRVLTKKVTKVTTRPINTNYELWDLFGGAYSAHVNSDTGKLEYENDNTSLENVYIASYSVGEKLNSEEVINDDDVYLPIRDSKIDWVVTLGAMKHGSTNVNYGTEIDTDGKKHLDLNKAFDDPYYILTTLKISTADVGMQLNPGHTADNSTLTLMTQVINGLPLRGFSSIAADKCYLALLSLTLISMSELLKGIEISVDSLDTKELKNAIAKVVLKALAGTSDTDSDLLSALMTLINRDDNAEDAYDIIKSKIPVSDPAVMHKLVSNIHATMTKAGIRIPMKGIMDVLAPSDGIYKIRGGKLLRIDNSVLYVGKGDLILPSEGEISEAESERLKLEKLQAEMKPILLHELIIGASYFIEILDAKGNVVGTLRPDGTLSTDSRESIKIDDKFSYYDLKDNLQGYLNYRLVEDVKKGRELSCYDSIWLDTNGFSYKLWDLESSYYLTHLLNGHATEYYLLALEDISFLENTLHVNANEIDLSDLDSFKNSLEKQLRRNLLHDLNSIGSGNSVNVRVLKNPKDTRHGLFVTIKVRKNTVKIRPFELVASKTYATTFGLKVGDDISLIVDDENFFLLRLLENKQETVAPTDYDLVLRQVSGSNTYIRYKSPNSNTKGLTPVNNLQIDWDGGNLYRIDSNNGKRMYKLPYHYENGKLVIDILVFTDINGNDVIYTSKLLELLAVSLFSYIEFGTNNNSELDALEIVNALRSVEKNSVKNLVSNIDKLVSENSLSTKTVINNLVTLKNNELAELLRLIDAKEKILFTKYSPLIRQLIYSGRELHTSFVESTHYLVSRTPALSHQSFMPMVLVGFDESEVNTAYVSRYLLYLLGSDFDVDKASLLGYVFHSGKFVTWSPYMSLTNTAVFEASKELPFPTGKEIKVVETLDTNIYDSIDKPIEIDWEDDNVTFTINGYTILLTKVDNTENEYLLTAPNYNKLNSFEKFLIKKAIWDKLPTNSIIISDTILDFNIGFNKLGETELGTRFTVLDNYDNQATFEEFIECFSDLYKLNNTEGNKPGTLLAKSAKLIKKLALLFDILNRYGVIPQPLVEGLLSYIQRDLNYHNTYFERHSDAKDAAINYISVAAYKITSDPVNNILASTSVDFLTGIVKDIASESKLAKQSKHFDTGNEMSKHRLNRLTLSGKANTGIEASALKEYEAEFLYVCLVLNFGTEEELKALLANTKILSKYYPLLANVYAKNIANVKSKEMYDTLKLVNLDEDAAIWLSAFLSLSTDNAKDPTLTKINADPEMIGLYNAGFAMGIPVDILVRAINSETGRAIAEILRGNAINGNLGEFSVTGALNYLSRGPILSYINGVTSITNIFDSVLLVSGLKTSDDKPVNGYNLISYLLPRDKYDISSIYIARNVIRTIKSAVYGNDGEEIYIPTIHQSIINRRKILERSLKNIQRSIEGLLKLYDKAVEQSGPTKRIENKLNKLVELEASLQESVDQLYIISENLRLTGELPEGEGSEYEFAQLLKENIERAESNHRVIKGTTVKGIIDNNHKLSRALNAIETYLDYLETIANDYTITGENGREYSILHVIRNLNYKAHEMSLLRPMLSLNLLLPNSLEDFLSLINKFEEIIIKRKSLLPSDFKTSELLDFLKLNESYGIDGLRIDIHLFIWNPDYKKAAIDAYGSIKYQVNILECLTKVPHYYGYLTTAEATYRLDKNISILFRDLVNILREVIRKDLKISSKTEITKRLKSASKYLSRRLNNLFLLSKNLTISADGLNITLGTPEGNLSFVHWMEETIIPYLKELYPGNKFLKAICKAAYHKSDNHNSIYPYTALVDSMSLSSSEKTRFYAVELGLSSLVNGTNSKFGNIPYVDLFFYYDLIVYDRQPGLLCLTPLFNGLVASGKSALVNEYKTFVANLDFSTLSLITLDESTIDEIERYTAPQVSIYELDKSKEKYLFVRDPVSKKFFLVLKLELLTSEVPDELLDVFDDDLIDGYDLDMDLGDIDYSEFSRKISLQEKINGELKDQFRIVGSTLNNPYLLIGANSVGFSNNILFKEDSVTSEGVKFQGTEITLNEEGKFSEGKLAMLEKLQTIGELNGHKIKSLEEVIVLLTDLNTKKKVIDVEKTKNNLDSLTAPKC